MQIRGESLEKQRQFGIKSTALVSVKCPPWAESVCKQPGSAREGFSRFRFQGRAQRLWSVSPQGGAAEAEGDKGEC